MCKPPPTASPGLDESIYVIDIKALRRAVLAKGRSEVATAYSKYARVRSDGTSLLLATTIEEEEEDEGEDAVPPNDAFHTAAVHSEAGLTCSSAIPASPTVDGADNPTTAPGSERPGSMATSAVESVASRCTKLFRRLLHQQRHHHHGQAHGHSHDGQQQQQKHTGGKGEVALAMPAPSTGLPTAAANAHSPIASRGNSVSFSVSSVSSISSGSSSTGTRSSTCNTTPRPLTPLSPSPASPSSSPALRHNCVASPSPSPMATGNPTTPFATVATCRSGSASPRGAVPGAVMPPYPSLTSTASTTSGTSSTSSTRSSISSSASTSCSRVSSGGGGCGSSTGQGRHHAPRPHSEPTPHPREAPAQPGRLQLQLSASQPRPAAQPPEAAQSRLAAKPPPAAPPPAAAQPHLVASMSGEDVRLAMRALQLAETIHDTLWASRRYTGGPADVARWEADMVAAGPLYDDAMRAARAVQHRALASLVKQAVRRYVNPQRGAPEDVLRVILELLTCCGGAAATTAATATAAAAAAAERGRARRGGGAAALAAAGAAATMAAAGMSSGDGVRRAGERPTCGSPAGGGSSGPAFAKESSSCARLDASASASVRTSSSCSVSSSVASSGSGSRSRLLKLLGIRG